MNNRIVCRHCGKEAEAFGARFCGEHYEPWITEMYQRYDDLVEEGHTRYQARLMAGLADPSED